MQVATVAEKPYSLEQTAVIGNECVKTACMQAQNFCTEDPQQQIATYKTKNMKFIHCNSVQTLATD